MILMHNLKIQVSFNAPSRMPFSNIPAYTMRSINDIRDSFSFHSLIIIYIKF